MNASDSIIFGDIHEADQPALSVTKEGGRQVVALSGIWTTHTIWRVDAEIQKLEAMDADHVLINIEHISSLDTAGAWLVERLGHHLHNKGVKVELSGARAGWQSLLDSVGNSTTPIDDVVVLPRPSRFLNFFAAIGHTMIEGYHDFLLAMHILGATIRGAQMKRGRGMGISLPAVTTQIDRMGVGAIPIVVLMSFIVGMIIAQQGAFQLRNFAAEVYAVDLVGILVFRELGVLMTAIMVAGRSGSAITAEIGSMKMREETDAMTVMGLNPIGVLVFPRLLALAIVMPLLTVVANIAAVIGAAFVLKLYADIPFQVFKTHMYDAVWMNTYLAGLIKAPFMAMIIGIIASVEGLKVGGSAESLGQRVTSSVVKSIFVVIVIDGFFAIFYAAINF